MNDEACRKHCNTMIDMFSSFAEKARSGSFEVEDVDKLISSFIEGVIIKGPMPDITYILLDIINEAELSVQDKCFILLSKIFYYIPRSTEDIDDEFIGRCIALLPSSVAMDSYFAMLCNIVSEREEFIGAILESVPVIALLIEEGKAFTESKTLFINHIVNYITKQESETSELIEIYSQVLEIMKSIIGQDPVNSLLSAMSAAVQKRTELLTLIKESEIIPEIVNSLEEFSTEYTTFALNFLFILMVAEVQSDNKENDFICSAISPEKMAKLVFSDSLEISEEALKCSDVMCSISEEFSQFTIGNILSLIFSNNDTVPFIQIKFAITIMARIVSHEIECQSVDLIDIGAIEFILNNIESFPDEDITKCSLQLLCGFLTVSNMEGKGRFESHFDNELFESKYADIESFDSEEVIDTFNALNEMLNTEK